jgi:hypothetical protein
MLCYEGDYYRRIFTVTATLIDSDNKDLLGVGLLYGSFIEMPGKRASPEKRSYYFGTEGVGVSRF